jgi:methyl-accepting chemotaxis protein
MTPRQIVLVRESWERVRPIRDRAGALFYERLIELDPRLAPMFPAGAAAQGRTLMTMIDTVVSSLDRLGDLVHAVRALGQRHAGYGVEAKHYDLGGRALLDILRSGLGEAFDSDVSDAWAVAYGTLVGVMQEGAAGHRGGVAPCNGVAEETAASS